VCLCLCYTPATNLRGRLENPEIRVARRRTVSKAVRDNSVLGLPHLAPILKNLISLTNREPERAKDESRNNLQCMSVGIL